MDFIGVSNFFGGGGGGEQQGKLFNKNIGDLILETLQQGNFGNLCTWAIRKGIFGNGPFGVGK